MDEFGPLPDELPESEFNREALSELHATMAKVAQLLRIAAVYVAAEGDPIVTKRVAVDRKHVAKAAEYLFVGPGEARIAWLNDFVELLSFQSCFLSHSIKDASFCKRLYNELKREGAACWYFPQTATWGKSVWGEIDRGIHLFDRLLVVCSEHSLTSGPVLREIERALQREDDERRQTGIEHQIVSPIAIDSFVFDGWNHPRRADLLAKVVGDFRGTRRSRTKYDTAFAALLKHLQSNR